jgi:hypothetical protein
MNTNNPQIGKYLAVTVIALAAMWSACAYAQPFNCRKHDFAAEAKSQLGGLQDIKDKWDFLDLIPTVDLSQLSAIGQLCDCCLPDGSTTKDSYWVAKISGAVPMKAQAPLPIGRRIKFTTTPIRWTDGRYYRVTVTALVGVIVHAEAVLPLGGSLDKKCEDSPCAYVSGDVTGQVDLAGGGSGSYTFWSSRTTSKRGGRLISKGTLAKILPRGAAAIQESISYDSCGGGLGGTICVQKLELYTEFAILLPIVGQLSYTTEPVVFYEGNCT